MFYIMPQEPLHSRLNTYSRNQQFIVDKFTREFYISYI